MPYESIQPFIEADSPIRFPDGLKKSLMASGN